MAASVLDVAAYVLESQGPMTHMKLQKLCYYSQAWHLAWDGVPLFPERIEAWANGPVVPVLYEALRGEFQVDRGTLAARLADPAVRSRVSARLAEEGLAPLGGRIREKRGRLGRALAAAALLAGPALIALALLRRRG